MPCAHFPSVSLSAEPNEVDAVASSAKVGVARGVGLLARDDDSGRAVAGRREVDRSDGSSRAGLVARKAGVDARAAAVGAQPPDEWTGCQAGKRALLLCHRPPVPADPAGTG